jgi:hypothetical protein
MRPCFRRGGLHRFTNQNSSQALIAKSFIEGGHSDIESFRALEKCFDQEHRGPLTHAHFMRTYSQRISSSVRPENEKADKPLSTLSEEPSAVSVVLSQAESSTSLSKKQAEGDNSGTKADVKKKGKGEQIAERHPKRAKRNNGPPGNPAGTKETRAAKLHPNLTKEASKLPHSNSRLVLFVSFSHSLLVFAVLT